MLRYRFFSHIKWKKASHFCPPMVSAAAHRLSRAVRCLGKFCQQWSTVTAFKILKPFLLKSVLQTAAPLLTSAAFLSHHLFTFGGDLERARAAASRAASWYCQVVNAEPAFAAWTWPCPENKQLLHPRWIKMSWSSTCLANSDSQKWEEVKSSMQTPQSFVEMQVLNWVVWLRPVFS